MTAATYDELQSLYIAYFGRPADPAGLQYWFNQGISEKEFAAIQFAQPEFQSVNAGLSIQAQINNLYLNLFNRGADAAGLSYWTNKVLSGEIQLAEIGIFLVKGAQGADQATIDAKVATANQYTRDVLASPEASLAYNPTSFDPWTTGPALTAGKNFLSGVSGTSIPTDTEIAAAVADMASGGIPGQTINLTPQLDTIVIATNGTTDIVNGIVTGPGTLGYSLSGSTWTPGDSIDGNGLTQVNLTITSPLTSGDPAAFGTIKDVADINLTKAVGGDIQFNAITWSNIGAINLNVGNADDDVEFASLQDGVNLVIADQVEGNLTASYTSDLYVELRSDGAAASYIDGLVTAEASAGDSIYVYISSTQENTPIALGDVSMLGVDALDGYFSVESSGNNSAITVGNIAVEGFTNFASVSITSAGDNSPITVGDVSLEAGDLYFNVSAYGDDSAVTVGNIDAVVTATGTSSTIYAAANYADKAADVTVGNIALTVADDSEGYVYVYNYDHTGDSAAANTTVGNVSLTNGVDDAGYVSFSVYNSATGAASVGATTVGDISLNVAEDVEAGTGNEFYVGIYSRARSTNAADLSTDFGVGDVTVGDLTINVGTAAEGSFYLSKTVSNNFGTSRTGTAAIGDTTVGDITVTLADNAEFTASIYNSATGDSTSTLEVGDITLGNVTVSGDRFSEFYLTVSQNAFTAESATVGDVTVGDISFDVGPDGTSEFYIYVENQLDSLGDVTVGNISFDVDAGGLAYGSISKSGETTVGDVTVGNVSILAGQTGAVGNFYIYNYNDGADTADVTGNTTVGDVTLSALALNASAYMSITTENDNAATGGAVGTVTIGDLALTAQGTNAFAGLYVSASSAASTGVITIGNITMDVTGDANQVYLEAYNEDNDIVIGDVVVTAGTNGGTAYLTLSSAAGDVTIGNVTVSGGDWANDNLENLFSWITATATGDITIGNVDYSGYGADATSTDVVTLNLDGTKGAAVIKGSALYDTITDNTGTNAITGGVGDDTFRFVNTNNNLTQATADTITDFSQTADVIQLEGIGAFDEYTEQAGAVDYATFLSNAQAADRDIFVQVLSTGGVAVAVDFNNGNTVDTTLILTNLNSLAQISSASFGTW